MQVTSRLTLPLMAAGQAQKHVTFNEAMLALDDVVALSVLDIDLGSPPPLPAADARYIVPAGAAGAWAGQAGMVACWRDGAWLFQTPRAGWLAFVESRQAFVQFTGAAWTAQGTALPMLGINAAAEASQRLNLRSAATLFDHEGGGHLFKINRAAATDTASLLFQTAYQGRAELGLQGDEDFRIKVSANGTGWATALRVDRTTGLATVAAAPTAAAGIATKAYVDSAIEAHVFDCQAGASQSVPGGAGWTKLTALTVARIASAAYSTGSCAYTAPRAGSYLFTAQVQVTMAGTAATVQLACSRNGAPSGNIAARSIGAGATDSIAVSAILPLSQGDTVELVLASPAACTIGAAATGFGGTRL